MSSVDQVTLSTGSCLSPLHESYRESSSSCPGQFPCGSPSVIYPPTCPYAINNPPALPQKKRRSTNPQTPFDGMMPRTFFERHHSHYDNVTDDEMPVPPFPVFIAPMISGTPTVYGIDYVASENAHIPQSPPPLPEKKNKHSKYCAKTTAHTHYEEILGREGVLNTMCG